VTKINQELRESPQLINEDPYGKGWFLHIEISNPKELADLLSPVQYRTANESEQ
jgi:glycine cleavage system H protein